MHQGESEKKMFVHASANAGGCVFGGECGGTHSDSVKKRYCKREKESHRVRYNTTEHCFQFQAFWLCRFLLAIINSFYYAIHNPLHRLAGWLAGGPASSLSACLPCSNLSRLASRYFQTMPISTSPWFRVELLSTL